MKPKQQLSRFARGGFYIDAIDTNLKPKPTEIQIVEPTPIKKPDGQKNQDLVLGSSRNPKEQVRYLTATDEINEQEAFLIFQHIKHYKFFRQFLKGDEDYQELDQMLQLCQTFQYELHKPGSIIIKQGDESNGKVYILFTGQVSVVVKNADFLEGTVGDALLEQAAKEKKKQQAALTDNPAQLLKRQITHETQNSPKAVTSQSPRFNNVLANHSPRFNIVTNQSPRFNATTIQSPHNKTPKCESPRNNANTNTTPPPQINLIPPENESLEPGSAKIITEILADHAIELEEIVEANSPATFKFRTRRKSKMAQSPTKSQQSGQQEQWSPLRSKEEILTPMLNSQHFGLTLQVTEHGIVKDIINEGGFFGEKAAPRSHRKASIIANSFAELLVFPYEEFIKVQEHYQHSKSSYIDLIKVAFNLRDGDKKSLPIIDNFMQIMELKDYERGSKIISQGQTGEDIYIIFSGECEVRKEVKYEYLPGMIPGIDPDLLKKRMGREEYKICSISPGNIFGLEVLFEENSPFQASIKVTGKRVTVMAFNRSKTLHRMPQFLYKSLQKHFISVQLKHLEILKKFVERKGFEQNDGELLNIWPFLRMPLRNTSRNTSQKRIDADAERMLSQLSPKDNDEVESRATEEVILEKLEPKLINNQPRSVSVKIIKKNLGFLGSGQTSARTSRSPSVMCNNEKLLAETERIRFTAHQKNNSTGFGRLHDLNTAYSTFFKSFQTTYKHKDIFEKAKDEKFINKITNFKYSFGYQEKRGGQSKTPLTQRPSIQKFGITFEQVVNRRITSSKPDLILNVPNLKPNLKPKEVDTEELSKEITKELKMLFAQYGTKSRPTSKQNSPKSTVGGFTFRGLSRRSASRNFSNNELPLMRPDSSILRSNETSREPTARGTPRRSRYDLGGNMWKIG